MKQTASTDKQAAASWTTARSAEEAARLLPHLSDEEQLQLFAASSRIFDTLSNSFADLVTQLGSSPSIPKTIGETAALACWHASTGRTGCAVPVHLFTMPDGVIAQTIDSLAAMAEAANIPFTEFEKRLALKCALEHYALISTTSGESN